MPNRHKLIVCLGAIATILVIVSAGAIWNKHSVVQGAQANAADMPSAAIEHGQGVVEFPSINDPQNRAEPFGKQLASYIRTHPNLELVSLVRTGPMGFSSWTAGYVVVFRPKVVKYPAP